MKKIKLVSAALLAAAAAAWTPWAAADYPNRLIRLIVPNPPGATNDKLARLLADRLSKDMAQPVIVENRAGASTAIGAQLVANTPADGYTLLLGTTTTYVLNPLTRSDLPYTPERDFRMISIVAETPAVILSNAKSPYRTLQDIVSFARSHPGELMYSSAGTGTSLHLAAEGFAAQAGIKLQHVPYQGSAPAMLALIKGEVPLMSEVVSGAVARVQSGQVRAIAVGSARRLPVLPDVPTFAEGGYPGFYASGWWGLAAPRATPNTVIDKLRAAVNRVLVDPTLQAAFQPEGLEISAPRDAAQVQAYVEMEQKHWSSIVKLVEAKGGLTK